ncbi:hypothetical protein PUW25_25465 (plasmid) [Paenibacillus urinalis]|uniref:Uncharacterized protein n=1 Tax=Paenibacillus urinalis TaxID=521520 RepID=A0ABY7XND8_9BACL|nr:hypothetical protein [Paenibacillus urinalis]WDI05160.1 hypothetical protein PUW25_25465 [Paenibacillus urinalis]
MELMKVYSEKWKEELSRSKWLNLADVVYYIQPGEIAESGDHLFSVRCRETDGGDIFYYFTDKKIRNCKTLKANRENIMRTFQLMMLPNPDFYGASYKIRRFRESGADAEVHR